MAFAIAGAHAGRHGARRRRRRGAESGVGARHRRADAAHESDGRCPSRGCGSPKALVRRPRCRPSGSLELAFGVNVTAAGVAAVTLISYVLVYTPLKTRTSLATLVGAVPGALPPVIGWTAATGGITLPALVLFGIVFFWQMPHFLAIAWMYRDDYARARHPAAAGARARRPPHRASRRCSTRRRSGRSA